MQIARYRKTNQRSTRATEFYSWIAVIEAPNGLRFRTPRGGSPAKGMPRILSAGYWWAGLGTIPALSRDETRHFAGINLKPRNVPKNAHAVLEDGSPTTTAPTHVVGVRMHVAKHP